ncbi:hypothetical protein ACR77J_15890 [Tissierella praeacuta]|uniref:hypothetical protein n=1 Tax=Tissierella praeacuta TaxID=43131 RepID=UPI003DA40D7F
MIKLMTRKNEILEKLGRSESEVISHYIVKLESHGDKKKLYSKDMLMFKDMIIETEYTWYELKIYKYIVDENNKKFINISAISSYPLRIEDQKVIVDFIDDTNIETKEFEIEEPIKTEYGQYDFKYEYHDFKIKAEEMLRK